MKEEEGERGGEIERREEEKEDQGLGGTKQQDIQAKVGVGGGRGRHHVSRKKGGRKKEDNPKE